jgi:hypothetical protein
MATLQCFSHVLIFMRVVYKQMATSLLEGMGSDFPPLTFIPHLVIQGMEPRLLNFAPRATASIFTWTRVVFRPTADEAT